MEGVITILLLYSAPEIKKKKAQRVLFQMFFFLSLGKISLLLLGMIFVVLCLRTVCHRVTCGSAEKKEYPPNLPLQMHIVESGSTCLFGTGDLLRIPTYMKLLT